MTRYIEFLTETGAKVLVETEDEEVAAPPGVEKAGLLDRRPQNKIATAAATFEEAVEGAIQHNVAALEAAVQRLAKPPQQLELTFGLKATGEIGNMAIAKVGGEASISVKLVWNG